MATGHGRGEHPEVLGHLKVEGPADFARFFLRSCYAHLPAGTPPMFILEEVRMGRSGLKVTFTNPYDAYHLLGQAFWCGAEYISFTVCNPFTQWDGIFPWANNMHCLPYVLPDVDAE